MPEWLRTAIFILLIFAAIPSFHAYRVSAAAREAARYQPAQRAAIVVPKGTPIAAFIPGVAAGIRPGDAVIAFTSEALWIGGKPAIPLGTALKGVLQHIATTGETGAVVRVGFDAVRLQGADFKVTTLPATASVAIIDDFDLLSGYLQLLAGASVGASIGAALEDEEMVATAMIGSAAAVYGPAGPGGPASKEAGAGSVIVQLSEDLEILP